MTELLRQAQKRLASNVHRRVGPLHLATLRQAARRCKTSPLSRISSSYQAPQVIGSSSWPSRHLVSRRDARSLVVGHKLEIIRRQRYRQFSMASSANPSAKAIAPGQTRVGWIGTGVMGLSMCGHILAAGYKVSVYNRTRSKAESLCQNGAVYLESPKAVAEQSDVVFTIVGYPSDVENITLGEQGIMKGLKPGGVFVDMTTSDPALAIRIFSVAKEKSCHAVDAPVSGGDVGAKAGKLAIFAGGEEEVVTALLPLFSCMGSVNYMGKSGLGQSTKMGNQIIIATTMIGLVEGMMFACKGGLDVTVYLQAIAGGSAGSKSLQLYASRLLKRDLNPGFYVNHFVKDLGIATEECRRMGLSLPGLALAQQLYTSLQAHGEGNLGTQALLLALERLNNMELPIVKD